jgi:hypothetical protein
VLGSASNHDRRSCDAPPALPNSLVLIKQRTGLQTVGRRSVGINRDGESPSSIWGSASLLPPSIGTGVESCSRRVPQGSNSHSRRGPAIRRASALPMHLATRAFSGSTDPHAMDVRSLEGKYLRLRKELTRARDSSHARRLREEIEGLETWLAQVSVPFADTLPLEPISAPPLPRDG